VWKKILWGKTVGLILKTQQKGSVSLREQKIVRGPGFWGTYFERVSLTHTGRRTTDRVNYEIVDVRIAFESDFEGFQIGLSLAEPVTPGHLRFPVL
jgi:hypothetical protein